MKTRKEPTKAEQVAAAKQGVESSAQRMERSVGNVQTAQAALTEAQRRHDSNQSILDDWKGKLLAAGNLPD